MSDRPPPRLRHPLPAARWPTAEEAAASRLFSPVRLGRTLEALSRTWVPAMVPWRATEDGEVTPDVLDWYERFARGRPGTLVVEATGIRDTRSGPLLRIGHDRFLPGLQRLVDTVSKASGGETRLLIQVIDFLAVRRRPEPSRWFGQFLALQPRHRAALVRILGDARWERAGEDALRRALAGLTEPQLREVLTAREWEDLAYGYRERVTDTHLPWIRDLPALLPGLFAAAAERAFRAGFDGVELHFAHAYTMASFLSALNTRDDGYGATLEGRLRLPLEVIGAVRDRVGADACVGCRYLGQEAIPGGYGSGDAAAFGVAFARAGLDFLSISKGGRFEDARQPRIGEAVYPYTGPSGHECMPTVFSDARGPFGRNLPLAAIIRRAVREAGFTTPLVGAGGICTFDQAESALREGLVDVIGAARQSLADPDWWAKMRSGHGAQVRRCSYTNYCEGLDQRHKQVTCRLWDKDRAEGEEITLACDGRRRLVAPPWIPPAPPPTA